MIIWNNADHVGAPETTVFRVMEAAPGAMGSRVREDARKTMCFRLTTAARTVT